FHVTGVQTWALPIYEEPGPPHRSAPDHGTPGVEAPPSRVEGVGVDQEVVAPLDDRVRNHVAQQKVPVLGLQQEPPTGLQGPGYLFQYLLVLLVAEVPEAGEDVEIGRASRRG